MSASIPLFIPSPRQSDDDGSSLSTPPEPPPGAMSLLVDAQAGLFEARAETRGVDRYVGAYVAAVRGATAILIARSWRRRDERPTSVWRLLRGVAPELREWIELFGRCGERRCQAESGVLIPETEAEALLRLVEEFLDIVGRCLLVAPR